MRQVFLPTGAIPPSTIMGPHPATKKYVVIWPPTSSNGMLYVRASSEDAKYTISSVSQKTEKGNWHESQNLSSDLTQKKSIGPRNRSSY